MLQAIFHLSQLTNILTPRQNALLNKKSKAKNGVQNKEETIQYLDSLLETCRNVSDVIISTQRLIDPNIFWDNNIVQKRRTTWNLSYISNPTFFENKYGFCENELYQPLKRNINIDKSIMQLFHTPLHPLHNLQQLRGFKTDKSVIAEQFRNPTMWTRIKKSIGKF